MKGTRVFVGLMFGLWSAAQAAAVQVSTDQEQYWRYELVTISASLGQSETAEAGLTAGVYRDGKRVVTVGNMSEWPLAPQPDGTFVGRWPIPFNPPLGTYRVKVSGLAADGTTLTAGTAFKVRGSDPHELPPGFCVMTDEGGKKGPYATPGLAEGEPKSWKNMIRWAQAMGADAFWECIGQTQVWKALKTEHFPWPAGYAQLMKRAGQAAHEAGMKYGAWITAFVVIGDRIEDAGYQFTTGYDRKSGALRTLRYVSMGCEKRLADMAALLKEFEAAPEVDFLGLDYMRTDVGGYEFASEFVRDMSIPTPADWETLTPEQRSLWMARLIEVRRDAAARERWQWWRAHKVAMVVRHLLDQVAPTKPVWVFSLGWMTGHQHGQDVAMMRDAGISFNAPMFYSITKPDFPLMLRDWQTYLKRGTCSLVIGECVDWNLLGRTRVPSGPREHFDRQVQTMQKLKPLTRSFGLFWHDLARAHYGARGPYGTWEWVVAGAASFSAVKREAGRISYDLQLRSPAQLTVGQDAALEVEITNASANTLTALSVELLDLPRLQRPGAATRAVPALGPGERARVAFTCRTDQRFAANGGQQMLAVKAVPATGADPYFAFTYVPVAEAEATTPTAVVTGRTGTGASRKN